MNSSTPTWLAADPHPDLRPSTPADDVITALSVLNPRRDPAELIRLVQALDPSQVAEKIIRQKVARIAVRRIGEFAPHYLRRLLDDPKLSARLRQLNDGAQHRAHVIAAVDEIAHEAAIGVQLMKGAVAREWYPDPELRDLNDVDVMVDSAQAAFLLAEALLGRGWDYEANEVPWIKATDDGTVYGQINLRAPSYLSWPNVDIHFATYSVRHCAYLAHVPSSRIGAYHTDRATTIVHLVANSAGDYLITTKDLNDLALCLDEGGINWSEIVKTLSSVHLQGFLRVAIEGVRRWCALSARAEREASMIIESTRRDRYANPQPGLPGNRVLGTVAHSAATGIPNGPITAAHRAYGAWRYYRRPLRLHPADRGISRLAARDLNAWTCVRLVPASIALALLGSGASSLRELRTRPRSPAISDWRQLCPGLETATTPYGVLLRSGTSVFVPTVYYGICRHLATALISATAVGPSAD